MAPDVWKEFDCYNLAAIGKTTNDDPLTPSWRLIGGYWQWGRKGPDESQWKGVLDNNSQSYVGTWASPYNYDTSDTAAVFLGNNLMLPVAGMRVLGDGGLTSRGLSVWYWSSSYFPSTEQKKNRAFILSYSPSYDSAYMASPPD